MFSFRILPFLVLVLPFSFAHEKSLFNVFFQEDLNEDSNDEMDESQDDVDTLDAVKQLRSVMNGNGGVDFIKALSVLSNMPVDTDVPFQEQPADVVRSNDGEQRGLKGSPGSQMNVNIKSTQRKLGAGNNNGMQNKQRNLKANSEVVTPKQAKRNAVNPKEAKRNAKTAKQQGKRKAKAPKSSTVASGPKRRVQETESIVDLVEGNSEAPSFDFVVGGFPKCGTTTLLKAFAAHPETDMAPSEQCAIASPGQADPVVLRKLDEALSTLSWDTSVKRSFKCPTAMYNYKSIVRLEKFAPAAKLVVGMRHPIKMLQSFYNYRVTEIYERGLADIEPIPTFTELIESNLPWKGVSLASVRFELFLMQLGKTAMSPADMTELANQNYELAVKPSNFTVFLYTVDQLEDADEMRSETLRSDLQQYLGLTVPIEPFGHENKNHAVGKAGHSESIDICDDKHRALRGTLLEQGTKTAAWISDYFIQSPDVVVPNKKHFVETLQSWSTDPCESEAKNAALAAQA